ncbi:MAG: hypothetical protein A3F90_06505 [Deltaproteobacteria bacterium RIFCSPLOWO2_12_FULL_60_19]|nr:MAG: hypothetical protein A3F90_06505 [Deltaproteobacteria bacterium RIFCSPLOWO2_12_FULL_60_19]
MRRLFRFLMWRHLRHHLLRTLLTVVGIALGVSVIVAIAMVNRTLVESFQRTVELIAGKAVLQVENGESGLSEALFPTIRNTPGVRDAAPAVEGFLPVAGNKGERLYVYGVDLLGDSSIRDHQFAGGAFDLESALDFIAQPDSLAITETFSRRLGLPVGTTVRLATSKGVRSYTVRALLREQGAAKVFGGSFALMDLPVAQTALGKLGKLDIVDIALEEGEDIETVKQRIAARVERAAEVKRPRDRGEQVESLLSSFRVGLFFVSLVALFVGFFLIYNTVSVSVIQRRREIGTLRCIGLLRRHILWLFVSETISVATVAVLLGLAAGVFLADAALGIAGETVSSLFIQIEVADSHLTLTEIWVALASGLGVSAAAAIYPVWQATRVSAIECARQAAWSARPQGVARVARVGLMLIGVSPIVAILAFMGVTGVEGFGVGVAAMMLFLLGLSFLTPALVLGWSKLFWRLVARLPGSSRFSWSAGTIACDSLRRAPGRSGMTIATLTISLAAVFTIATFVHSVRGSLLLWVDKMVTADLIVHSGARTAGALNVPIREELGVELGSLPGVEVVDYYRLIRTTYEGKPIVIESFAARTSAHVRTLPMVNGDAQRALKGLGDGEGVIVSESFHGKFGKGVGDVVELATPSGPVPFKILAIYVDYSSDSGSVLIDRALYKQHWRDELVDAFDLWLAPNTEPQTVIRRINEDFGDQYQLFVSTHGELRENVVALMEQSFRVNYAVELVAVVVAMFGVINTLLASVLDRTRELGVLRAVGATRKQIRRIIMAEAGWMGLFGGVLGLFAGTIMSYHHVVYNTRVLTGWTFQYAYPVPVAAGALIVPVLLCLIAGYFPARRAARAPIVSAIGYE